MLKLDQIVSAFDLSSASIIGRPQVQRHLSDLRGCFADREAYQRSLAAGDPLVYTVASVEPADGEGDLHYGLGMINPGRIGDEYWMTKGHLHTWRPAGEFYVGLQGNGEILLEDEATGQSRLVPLTRHSVVYVPGHTAHRTLNTGAVPLLYLGIYSARAGHDYATIAERNFRSVVVERQGRPTLLDRTTLSAS